MPLGRLALGILTCCQTVLHCSAQTSTLAEPTQHWSLGHKFMSQEPSELRMGRTRRVTDKLQVIKSGVEINDGGLQTRRAH